ncbi:endonuclease/exonuclease/phosphatase family protein [Kaarinaea lacus]
MIKTLRIALSGLALSILITGCVTIPEQTQLVSQSRDGDTSTLSGSCKTFSMQHVNQSINHSTHVLNPSGFSILNWNIYKGSRETWREDFINFSQQQDIVLLQEALLSDELKSALKDRELNWHLNTAFYYDDLETGVMTASRIGSGYHCALRTKEPIIRVPKTALISRYPIAGMSRQLLVANIHGINFTLGLESYASQMMAVEEILSAHDGPIVLAGDFNNWSDKRTQVLLDMMKRLSLEQLPYNNHNRTIVFGNAIDHVFFRGLTAVTHQTHHVTSSDHNPITVTFKVSDARLARIVE